MLISRAVTVKSRVTPALRAQMGAETQKAMREVDEEIERALAERERMKSLGKSEQALALEKKARDLSARREALLSKLREIGKLREGQEVTRGQVQGFCDVKVGDVWPFACECEIVVEDGKVVAIREGASVTVAVSQGGPTEGAEK